MYTPELRFLYEDTKRKLNIQDPLGSLEAILYAKERHRILTDQR